jgi:hypothetical protein
MNHKMRRLYSNAVDRFEAKMRAHGVTGKRAMAEFRTWHGFKEAMDCGGAFGVYGGLVAAWCRSQKPINALVDLTEKLFLDCGGDLLAGAVGGAIGVIFKWAATTIKVGTMSGAAITGVACTLGFIWDNVLFSWTTKAKRHALDPARVG